MTTASDRLPTGGPDTARMWPAWAVPAKALGEWLQLQAALEELRPHRPACAGDPEAWWVSGRSPGLVVEAVEACHACPLEAACAAYARAADEREGVWGGTTPAERSRARG